MNIRAIFLKSHQLLNITFFSALKASLEGVKAALTSPHTDVNIDSEERLLYKQSQMHFLKKNLSAA